MIRFCNHNLDWAERLIAAGAPFKAGDAAEYAVDAFNTALEQRTALIQATGGNLTPTQADACEQALALQHKVSDLCGRRTRACQTAYKHGKQAK